ncbi:hypothetical protein MUK42_27630 [Musa troglodytarum]|uniref:Rx N-terminal domain-containing protein n=1 Tax=Musa troglodytarum TaxID=320322 RepID=A0A9E7K993_9LILI|nr:hypothetical protein MUK42_27630 [Musa troglodytarum]
MKGSLEQLLMQFKDVAYDACDLLDEFRYQIRSAIERRRDEMEEPLGNTDRKACLSSFTTDDNKDSEGFCCKRIWYRSSCSKSSAS